MNYTQMKKEELIKTLKERDAVIAGFEETNATLTKENDDLTVKIKGLTKDCEGMTERCNNAHVKIEELKASLLVKHKQNDDLEAKLKISEENVINLNKENERLNNNYVELVTQSSIEEANYVSRKRLYISTIILLTIGIVVLAIL